jgi:uncharacterized phage protein (TIGR01671 family)
MEIRPIKFRGWNGERMFNYEDWFTLDEQLTLCFEDSEDHSYVDNSDVDFPNRVKLMQYTGLKDKNGKEIYEGDILEVDWQDDRYPIHNIGPVKWDEENSRWDLGEGGSPKKDAELHFEVVGNIYEKPELLK